MPYVYGRWSPPEVVLNPWVSQSDDVVAAFRGRNYRSKHRWDVPGSMLGPNPWTPPKPPRFQRTDIPYGMGAPNDLPAVASAFAASFIADIEAAGPLKAALLRRQLDADGLARIVTRDLDAARRGDPGPALFPNVRAVAGEFLAQEARRTRPGSGLGQWDSIISAVGAAAGAAAKIYSAVQDQAAAKQLLQLSQQKNQTEIQIAQIQAKAAQVALAAANAQTGTADGSLVATGSLGPVVAGVPVIPAVGAAVLLALGLHVAFGRK